jgi:hypothetical protein
VTIRISIYKTVIMINFHQNPPQSKDELMKKVQEALAVPATPIDQLVPGTAEPAKPAVGSGPCVSAATNPYVWPRSGPVRGIMILSLKEFHRNFTCKNLEKTA